MSEVKVSVIMPMYNAAQYLEKCMKSVLSQTLRDIEIICVDDGSTDGTLDILNEFAKKDERIKIIKQQNLYAGAARNSGIKIARGRYFAFWDADDFFEPNTLETLYKKAEKEEADICLCSAYDYDNETGRTTVNETILKRRYLPNEAVFSIKTHPEYIFNVAARAPWNKIVRADFMKKNGIQFQNLQNSNDTYFSMISMYYAERITYVTAPLIYYRVNNAESITGKAFTDPTCTFEAYKRIYTEITENGIDDSALKSFYNRLYNGLLRSIEIQGGEKGLALAYDTLKQEAFPFFDISNHLDDDISFMKSDLEDMRFIADHTLCEYLSYKYRKAQSEKQFYKARMEKTLKIRIARRLSRFVKADSPLFDKAKKLLHFR